VVRGTGTLLNMAAVLLGSGLGVALGGHLPERTRTTVTDALGLVTLVLGGLNLAALQDDALRAAVGDSAPLLVVLGALLVGGIVGSLLQLEARLEGVGAWLQRRHGFAALAFAASLGWGVAASALSVGVVQGLLTLLGAALGGLLPASYVAAVTATGGVLLLGAGLRLLAVKQVAVGDLLPALVAAPVLTALVTALQ
jgi:uncharacterized membrane protein YqgA involved in biofilm formation